MATIRELAERVNLPYEGDGGLAVRRVRGLDRAGAEDLSFVQSGKFRAQALASAARALVAPPELELAGKTVIRSPHPQLTLIQLTPLLHPSRPVPAGIDPRAVVGAECHIASSASVQAGAVLEQGVRVGERSVVAPGVFLGDGVSVGDDCAIHPNVTIEWGCRVGNRVVVHGGTVIGSDGFGFIQHEGRHVKIPHVGNVVIEDDVEIGANCTIDRATYESTVIGAGTKLDNQVHVAHNCRIGPFSLFAGQTGLAGTATVGAYFVVGGQSGVAGHIVVPDHVTLGPKSVMTRPGRSGEVYAGIPARPMREWKRAVALFYGSPRLQRLTKDWKARAAEIEPDSGEEE
jgi:UDP-3-O-[3-hydroxymyristoyl] glucosamine N-acyltransferase